jgi:hypothetical protein
MTRRFDAARFKRKTIRDRFTVPPQLKASEGEYESTAGQVPLRPRALLFSAELMIGEPQAEVGVLAFFASCGTPRPSLTRLCLIPKIAA